VEEKMVLPDPVVNNLETAKENIAEKNDEVVPPRPPVVNEGLVKEVVVEKTNEVVPPQPPVVIEEVVNEEVVKEEKISNPNLYNGRPVVEGYIPGQLYIARGTSRGDQLIYRSTSPRYKGVYYKIQVTALAQPNLDIPLFDSIRSLGLLTDEYLIDRNLSRVLLGDFFNLQEASSILQQVWLGGFPEAYLVKYENGSRFGRVNPN
jgi:hypothetical protein